MSMLFLREVSASESPKRRRKKGAHLPVGFCGFLMSFASKIETMYLHFRLIFDEACMLQTFFVCILGLQIQTMENEFSSLL
mmetsp:Transcript_10432/g.13539  ORF Transcript_10432/g.13539 Transcript_10432/m.13539 type:complete len:81 (+) Transcript_10432:477-719(+)